MTKRIFPIIIFLIYVSICLTQAEVITIKTDRLIDKSEYNHEIEDTTYFVKKLNFRYSNLPDSLTMILNEFVKSNNVKMYLFSIFEKPDSTIVIEIANWDYWSAFKIPAYYNEIIDEIGMAKYNEGKTESADFYILSYNKQQSIQLINDLFFESDDTLNYKKNIMISPEQIFRATEPIYNFCRCFYKSGKIEIVKLIIATETIVNK